jgi:hypothetical protein
LLVVTTTQRRSSGKIYQSFAVREAQPRDPWDTSPIFLGHDERFAAARREITTRGLTR